MYMRVRALTIAAAVLALSVAVFAQETKRDAKVQAVLDAVVAAYKAMPTYQARVNFKVNLSNPELMPEPVLVTLDVKAMRPNKVNLSYTEKSPDGKTIRHQIVCDGSSVFRWRGDANTFSKTRAGAAFPVLPSNITLPDIDVLLRGKDFKDLPLTLTVGAPAKVGALDVDVLEAKLNQPGVPVNGSVRLMFGQKDRTARAIYLDGQGKNPRDNKDISFKIEAVYETVQVNPALTAADFTFTPPPGARLEQTPVKPDRG